MNLVDPAQSAANDVGVERQGSIAIEVRNLHKRFGATYALRGVDLVLKGGCVHALLGANGCGKSTLVKVLAGYHSADSGEIIRPSAVGETSIAFVHQDLGLVGPLTVTENLAFATGFQTRMGAIKWAEEHRRAERILQEYKIDCSPREAVSALGPAEQTMIAIARAMSSLPTRGGVLVLDEPTARLPVNEADRLIQLVRLLKTRGVAVLYITHRLDEVLQLADEVTVLRDGVRVHCGPIQSLGRNELVRLIVGKNVETIKHVARSTKSFGSDLLAVADLSGQRVQQVSLSIEPGELLGIARLVGSSRSELGRLIFGLQRPTSGKITFQKEDLINHSSEDAVAGGMGYVPQERAKGIFGGLSVEENTILANLQSVMARFGVSTSRSKQAATDVVSQFQVKAESLDVPIEALSGGNQQKVSLGKWLRRNTKLMILDEPTQGIDVGARTEIFHVIRRLARERGIGALVLDSDLDILAEHCDRVLVMARGRIVKAFEGAALTADAVRLAVYGH